MNDPYEKKQYSGELVNWEAWKSNREFPCNFSKFQFLKKAVCEWKCLVVTLTLRCTHGVDAYENINKRYTHKYKWEVKN